jgi:hypothetical protein
MGVSRQNIGPLAMSTFQQPIKFLAGGAKVGVIDQMIDTSSRLMVGLRPELGTGGITETVVEKHKETIDRLLLNHQFYSLNQLQDAWYEIQHPDKKEEVGEVILPDRFPAPALSVKAQEIKGDQFKGGKVNNSPALAKINKNVKGDYRPITPLYGGSRVYDLMVIPIHPISSYQVGPIPLKSIGYIETFEVYKVFEVKVKIIKYKYSERKIKVFSV